MTDRKIPFSPPDITDDEINAVVEVLKSGWITSGAKVKALEEAVSKLTKTKKTNAFSSATNAMELALRLYGIKEGDEVITTPYTYAATSNIIVHTGAKVIFVDLPNSKNNSFNMDAKLIEPYINEKTKAVIAVDVGGLPCDYEAIKKVIESKKHLFKPSNNKYQEELKRPLFLMDSAHSIGAIYKNKQAGNIADFTAFSFHAVKNVTTAEGGALTYNDIGNIKAEIIYKELTKWALHGQDKSAFEKSSKKGGWQYSIDIAGYKCNLSDIHAAIGVSQLKRYDKMIERRKKIVSIYNDVFSKSERAILPILKNDISESSYHLYPLRIDNYSEEERNKLIMDMEDLGIVLNVHYLPVPAHKAYIDLGFNIADYPNSFDMYKNEATLPLYSTLSEEDAEYIARSIFNYLK